MSVTVQVRSLDATNDITIKGATTFWLALENGAVLQSIDCIRNGQPDPLTFTQRLKIGPLQTVEAHACFGVPTNSKRPVQGWFGIVQPANMLVGPVRVMNY